MSRAIFTLSFILFLFTQQAFTQNNHEIKVKIDNFEQEEIYLAVHYGEKQYIQDTTTLNDEGAFVFSGPEPLDPGVYLVVLPPDNNYFQILVGEDNQKFSIKTDNSDLALGATFENSDDNILFYQYLNFISQKSQQAMPLRETKEKLTEEDPGYAEAQEKLEKLDEEVQQKQMEIIEKYPDSYTAAIVKANINIPIPEFEGTEEERLEKQWNYRRDHYFDNLDLADPRMLRTPFLFQRVDFFVNKLHVQHPDSLAKAMDYVLQKMEPAPETYRYFVSHFLNFFASSKFVGMDAGYVHMVEKYYESGKADWVDEEDLEKMIDNAKKLKPLLIGKKAPNITTQKKDGTKVTLYDINTPYTILYFWKYDCPACKKSTPHMKDFYEKFKDKGVTLMAVCTKYTDDVPDCWKYIEENEIGDWLHTADPYNRSKFGQIYDVRSTPMMYVLDENKEIISKRLGAEQLEEVMTKIMEQREKEQKSDE